jgi:hypothetical protein
MRVSHLICPAAICFVFNIAGAAPTVDLTKYDPACGVDIRQDGDLLRARWPGVDGAPCAADLSLKAGQPLIPSLMIGGNVLERNIEPVFLIATGARVHRPGVKYIFFDKPAAEKNGPVRKYQARLDAGAVRVSAAGKRAEIAFNGLSAGPFAGELIFRFCANSPFIYLEAAMSQQEKDLAYIYDAVLVGEFKTLAWQDTADQFVRESPQGPARPIAVRSRTVMSERETGTVAVVATPHAFFFPRDYSDNFKFAQAGQGRFGLRQDPAGGAGHKGAFIPWFDAPQGKTQHMGFFVYLSAEKAEKTLDQIKRYTHGDTYQAMPGYVRLAGHMHSALTVHEKTDQPRAAEFKKVFAGMHVDAFHLAEFHGDGHPSDVGTIRLDEEKAMFEMCRKYSDSKFLMIPGEEANTFFPGHTVLLFPKPVYLTLHAAEGKPFSERIEPYGTVYHPHDAASLADVLRKEASLVWTSHARIKGSEKMPDLAKSTDWYQSDIWLGATWKAMPADLSEPRLGVRSLDLLDDMNLWGQRKMILGEVDCFTIDSTHEIYAHMNINYLRLDRLPASDDWTPILDVLKKGDFFVTTGEILIHSCAAQGGKIEADVEWTFPLAHAELVTCDGKRVQRKTIALPDTTEFGRKTFQWPVDLREVQWFRVEVWDIAYDGAFTQPKYLK